MLLFRTNAPLAVLGHKPPQQRERQAGVRIGTVRLALMAAIDHRITHRCQCRRQRIRQFRDGLRDEKQAG